VAAHQPDGYNPPHQFVDQLVSAGLSSVLSWRHTHMFSAEGEAEAENETRVSDDVQTPVPASALRQMFATGTASSPPTWPPSAGRRCTAASR